MKCRVRADELFPIYRLRKIEGDASTEELSAHGVIEAPEELVSRVAALQKEIHAVNDAIRQVAADQGLFCDEFD